MKPYKDSSNIRVFSKDVKPLELVWHKDDEDRNIEILEGEGWKFQFDNELPLTLTKGDRIFITKHRIHMKKFPEVKDENLAGEVYRIMQEQNGFDDYDDEQIVSFMKAAATWEDAEDVADYFDEPASDLGRLIASYYQEESGYEDYDDQWDNYLDYLFDQTERQGDDIDDWRIPDEE